MVIEKEKNEGKVFRVYAIQDRHPCNCLKCNSNNFKKYGKKTVSIVDAPHKVEDKYYMPKKIILSMQRYKCLECGSLFAIPVQELIDLAPNHKVTCEAISFIKEHLNLTGTELANMLGLNVHTTRSIINKIKKEQ